MKPGVFFDGISVSHPGDVIADGPFNSAGWYPFLNMLWKDKRFSEVGR